jgi:hypothetical protein
LRKSTILHGGKPDRGEHTQKRLVTSHPNVSSTQLITRDRHAPSLINITFVPLTALLKSHHLVSFPPWLVAASTAPKMAAPARTQKCPLHPDLSPNSLFNLADTLNAHCAELSDASEHVGDICWRLGSKRRDCKECGESVGGGDVEDGQLNEYMQHHRWLAERLKDLQEVLRKMESGVMWKRAGGG